MQQRRHLRMRDRGVLGLLAVLGIGAASVVASAGGSSAAASVVHHDPRPRTTDVHVLAYNDFHGNLEPGTLNIYGQFAGGAAWLAKAVDDKQAAVRRHAADRHRRRQHRRQPARRRPVLRRAVDDRRQPDARRLRVGRQPRVRQGLGTSCCASRTAAAGPTSAAPARRTRCANGKHRPTATRAPTSSTCRRTSSSTTPGSTLFPAYGIKAVPRAQRAGVRVGVIGEVLKDTPTIVTPTGVAGLTFSDEADAANAAVAKLRRKGVNTSILVIHQGGFQTGTGRAQRLRRQPRRQRHRCDRRAARPVDQGHRVGPHPRRVPLHDHDARRRDAADHQRSVVRPRAHRHHADRSTTGPASWSPPAPTTRSCATRATRAREHRTSRCSTCPRTTRVAEPSSSSTSTASAPLANQVIGKVSARHPQPRPTRRRDPVRRRHRRRPARGHQPRRPRAAPRSRS